VTVLHTVLDAHGGRCNASQWSKRRCIWICLPVFVAFTLSLMRYKGSCALHERFIIVAPVDRMLWGPMGQSRRSVASSCPSEFM
jgi:hypothetical protein